MGNSHEFISRPKAVSFIWKFLCKAFVYLESIALCDSFTFSKECVHMQTSLSHILKGCVWVQRRMGGMQANSTLVMSDGHMLTCSTYVQRGPQHILFYADQPFHTSAECTDAMYTGVCMATSGGRTGSDGPTTPLSIFFQYVGRSSEPPKIWAGITETRSDWLQSLFLPSHSLWDPWPVGSFQEEFLFYVLLSMK